MKTAIARMLTCYQLLPCEKTITEMVVDPKSPSFMPKGGIWIQVQRR
jgi:hypothetical protein